MQTEDRTVVRSQQLWIIIWISDQKKVKVKTLIQKEAPVFIAALFTVAKIWKQLKFLIN